MSEWEEITLGQFLNFRTGKLDSNRAKTNGNYPFFTCSPETLRIDEYAFDDEAVLLAGNNANGVFPVKYYHGKFNAYQRTYVVTPKDKNRTDVRWLYFLTQSFVRTLQELSIGSATRFITKQILENFVVTIPSVAEQKAITSILGALDDKIELNRKMNATLETMARALFKSWFVDFDPVRAKSKGRPPYGMDTETAALFPSRLVPSELGDIPEGWEVDHIGNAVTAVGGSTPSTEHSEYWFGGQHAWVTPKDLSALKSPVLFSTERKITDAGIRVISSGLLPLGTVLMSSRAPIGYIAIAETPVAINQGFIAIVCDKQLPNLYVWQWLQTNLDMIKNHANGSTFQEISKSSFRPLACLVPEAKVLEKFQEVVLPIWQRLVANEKERLRLEKNRDYLLPKLISGDIRIPDAEKMMELCQ